MAEKQCFRLFLASFVLFQAVDLSASIQTFEQPPQNTEVNPKSDAMLVCKIYNKRGTCSWQKDNKPVGMHENKYEWAGNQVAGDCSIWVRQATLEFDDGLWECQVTASDFASQDALTSTPARLIVRVQPQAPRIEFNGSQVAPGMNVSSKAGQKALVKCTSKFGNPPATIKWLMGDTELPSNQTNTTEPDNPRTWMATSLVEVPLSRGVHNKSLRCVAMHESYPTKSNEVKARLDVQYLPETRLVGTPTGDIEEERDRVVLQCLADANPPAYVTWSALDREGTLVSSQDILQFLPVTRRDAGRYACRAKNDVGESAPLIIALDVKYGPRVVSVTPRTSTSAKLYAGLTLSCSAEGNPPPTYQWLQRLAGTAPTADTVILRGSEPILDLRNVTYEHQGQYVCKVTNVVGGSEKSVQSEPISVQIKGPPQILRPHNVNEVSVVRGNDAVLRLVVCADPKPTRALWQWGSLELEAGGSSGKFQAEDLTQEERDDCSEARFHVNNADLTDSRTYHLTVANERGEDRLGVHLLVREPVSMTTMLSVASGCLLLLLLLVLLAFYAIRREKCCLSRRGDFRPADLESEKSDVDSTSGKKTPRIEVGDGYAPHHHSPVPRLAQHNSSHQAPHFHHPQRGPHLPMGPPSHFGHHLHQPNTITANSPDAMKVRLAAMVLGAPTRV